MSFKFTIFLIVFLFINKLLFVNSTYSSPSTYTFRNDVIYAFGQFGFLENGTYILNIKRSENHIGYENQTTVIALCPNDVIENMDNIDPCEYIGAFGSKENYNFPFLYGCEPSYEIISNISNYYISMGGTITNQGYYNFISFSCWTVGPNSIDLDISYEQLNPGHNHLSMEYLYFPTTFLVFLVLWAIVSIFWLVNWIMFKKQSTKLHFIISLIPISTIIYIIYTYCFFSFYKEEGDFGIAVYIVSSLIYSMQITIFLISLMLISMGFGILPKSLRKVRLLLIIIGIVLFFGTFIGSFYSGKFNYVILITYLPVPLFIVYMAQTNVASIKSLLKKSNNSNGEAVTTTTTTTSSNKPAENNQERELEIKRTKSIYYLFQAFKWTMVPYCIIIIITALCSIYIYFPFLFLLIQLILNLSLFLMIVIIFRLKRIKKDTFYEFFDEDTFNNNNEIELK